MIVTATEVLVEGNSAVITGASSGIGRSMAMTCASKGMHVWLVDIDQEELAIAVDMCVAKALDKNVQVRADEEGSIFAVSSILLFSRAHMLLRSLSKIFLP